MTFPTSNMGSARGRVAPGSAMRGAPGVETPNGENIHRAFGGRPSLTLGAADLAFAFWLLIGGSALLTPFVFPDAPVMATLVGGVMSLSFVFVAALLMLALPGNAILPRLPPTVWCLAFFLVWVALSVLWSQSNSRFISGAYVLLEVFPLAAMFLLLTCGREHRILERAVAGYAMGTVAVIGVLVASGTFTADGRLGNEEFIHPNPLGRQATFAAIGQLYLLARARSRGERGPFKYFVFICLSLGVFLSLSKTSIGAFLIGVSMMVMGIRGGATLKLVVSSCIIVVLLAVSTVLMDYLERYIGGGHDDVATLTGRTLIWAATWDMINADWASWLMGNGALSFRDIGPQIASVRLVHAHNEFLQTWFSFGVIGLALAISIYATFTVQAIRLFMRPEHRSLATYGLALLACTLVFSLTEADLITLVLPLAHVLLTATAMHEALRTCDTKAPPQRSPRS